MSTKNNPEKQYNGAPATKGDFLMLRKDIASFKDVVALKSDLITIKKDMALRKDIASFKDVVALKSDLLSIKKNIALKSDLKKIKDVVALKSDLITIKKDMALKSDLKEFKDVVALKSDLISLKHDILEETKITTKKIVDDAVGELTVIVSGSFTRMERSMDDRFDGVNNSIQGLWNAFDSHTLDCVRRDEHDRLEKRVRVLEGA